METGAFEEPCEELPAALRAAIAADSERLLEQLRLLEQMPQVRLVPSSIFDRATPPGSNPQLRGVSCKLRCCKGENPSQKCNALTGEKACPTHVEAAQLLRAKVMAKHGSAECIAKAQASLAAEAEQGAVGSSSSAAPAETLTTNGVGAVNEARVRLHEGTQKHSHRDSRQPETPSMLGCLLVFLPLTRGMSVIYCPHGC